MDETQPHLHKNYLQKMFLHESNQINKLSAAATDLVRRRFHEKLFQFQMIIDVECIFSQAATVSV